jgi:hypothetical protein
LQERHAAIRTRAVQRAASILAADVAASSVEI